MSNPDDLAYSSLQYLINGLSFYCKAGNAHAVHPPFLFNLYTEAIRAKTPDREVMGVMNYIRELKREHSPITYTAYGSAEGTAISLSPAEVVRKQSSGKRKGKLLYRLVKRFQPATLLELGTNLGVGTAFLLSAKPDAEVITVEASPELAGIARRYFDTTAPGGVSLFQGRFSEQLPIVLDRLTSLDFVYFDGDHRQEATLEYFRLCSAKANNNSVFVFDDIHWSTGMEKAWKSIVNDPKVSLSVDLYQLGLVFFRQELSKQFFRLRF